VGYYSSICRQRRRNVTTFCSSNGRTHSRAIFRTGEKVVMFLRFSRSAADSVIRRRNPCCAAVPRFGRRAIESHGSSKSHGPIMFCGAFDPPPAPRRLMRQSIFAKRLRQTDPLIRDCRIVAFRTGDCHQLTAALLQLSLWQPLRFSSAVSYSDHISCDNNCRCTDNWINFRHFFL